MWSLIQEKYVERVSHAFHCHHLSISVKGYCFLSLRITYVLQAHILLKRVRSEFLHVYSENREVSEVTEV